MSETWSSESGPVVEPPPSPEQRERARARLRLPATGLLVAVGLGIVWSLLDLFGVTLVLLRQLDLPPGVLDQMQGMGAQVALRVASFALSLGVQLLIGLGALCMLRTKGWTLALVGSIAALIPCGCCCVLTLPFGIWALVLLFDKDVKRAFV